MAANKGYTRRKVRRGALRMEWRGRRRSDNVEDRRGLPVGRKAAVGAVGDDRLQRAARGYVSPDSFTHGSSAQRMRWFRRGFDSGDVAGCDTFRSREL
jgi:predicted metalloprotease